MTADFDLPHNVNMPYTNSQRNESTYDEQISCYILYQHIWDQYSF